VRVLNIDVQPDLLHRWRSWFAPDPQPFLVDAALAETLAVERAPGRELFRHGDGCRGCRRGG
jgi:hypothetical protein